VDPCEQDIVGLDWLLKPRRIQVDDADDDSPYWLTERAARYLRITPHALRSLVHRGRLKPLPGFRQYRFTKEILDKFLAGGKP
jgi:excisionase family DNA binding protein